LITAGADGTPRVIIEQIEEHLRDAAEDAVDLCPSGAIALREDVEK
jgi:ferredoxin